MATTSHSGAHRVLLRTLLPLIAGVGCGSDPTPETPLPPLHRPSVCADPSHAPIRDGRGGFACTPVGADQSSTVGDWPDTDVLSALGPLPEPVYRVRAGASGGDGSMARPFGSLSAAFDAAGARGGTVLLSRGMHLVDAPLNAQGPMFIAGVGANESGSVLAVTAPGPALTAVGVSVRMARVRLGSGAAAPGDGLVARAGASLRLLDVLLERFANGVLAEGARVEATGLSILRAGRTGLILLGGSAARVERFVVRDGANQGIYAESSKVVLSQGLVSENGRHGLSLVGTSGGDGVAGCEGDALTMPGPHDCVSDVSITCNGIAGVYLDGARDLLLRRATISGTREVISTTGGDGLYVGRSATVTFDRGLTLPEDRGHGSEVVGNARVGLLVQGTGATLDVHGALVGSNRGPGIYLADHARVGTIGVSLIEDNASLGIGATPSTEIGDISGNSIAGTRLSALITDRGPVQLGDGISVASLAATSPRIADNIISSSARFGAILVDSSAILRNNVGRNNRYGLKGYNAMITDEGGNSIEGREDSPLTPQPRANVQLTLTGASVTR